VASPTFSSMTELQVTDEILGQLQVRYPRFHPKAYLFVLAALHHVIRGLPEARHISGSELAHGLRELALDRYGPVARMVLQHWGIHTTEDVGDVVFALVEQEVLVKEEEDRAEDFYEVFDFEDVFERCYPWEVRF